MIDKELLKVIDRQVIGIIWNTPTSITHDFKFIETFDYVFNGLINQSFVENKINPTTNFFITDSFDHKIFLFQTVQASGISNLKALLKANNFDSEISKKIITIGTSAKKLKTELTKEFELVTYNEEEK